MSDRSDTFRVTMQAANVTGSMYLHHEWGDTWSLMTNGPGCSYLALHGSPDEILAAVTILYKAAEKLKAEADAKAAVQVPA